MSKRTKVKCSKCSRGLFYIPSEYEMTVDVTCLRCERGTKKTKTTAASNYAKTKKGIRSDIDSKSLFRSATEANTARLFNHLGAEWKFEERAFTFAGYKTRPHVYVMDFEITSTSKAAKKLGLTEGWYEVKGYMDSRSRNKLRRLKKCYPDDFKKTKVILSSHYNKKAIEFCKDLGIECLFYDLLAKEYSDKIPNWE